MIYWYCANSYFYITYYYCGRQASRSIALTIPDGMYDRFQWRHLCWQDHARVDGENCDLILVDGSPKRNDEYLMFQVKSESKTIIMSLRIILLLFKTIDTCSRVLLILSWQLLIVSTSRIKEFSGLSFTRSIPWIQYKEMRFKRGTLNVRLMNNNSADAFHLLPYALPCGRYIRK